MNEHKLSVVSRVVLPSAEFSRNSELFIRTREFIGTIGNAGGERLCSIDFDTWMNIFPASKYYRYCALGGLYLRVEVDSPCRICLETLDRTQAFGLDRRVQESVEAKQGVNVIEVPRTLLSSAGISFSMVYPVATPARLISAAWCTDAVPVRPNRMAVVICTFRREPYVRRNMRLFAAYVAAHPEYRDRLRLFVVDNGRTLSRADVPDCVTLIPSKNAGGAGGFARGAIEVLRSAEPFDRILFMDDDVTIIPDAWEKTLLLTDFLKPECREAFVDGAMIRDEDKSRFFENLAERRGLWVDGVLPHELDLNDPVNTLVINENPDSIYGDKNRWLHGAWFFSCFPVEMLRRDGLPLPIFFRGDDVEWGWRHHNFLRIAMNGICVWHSSFEWRVSDSADNYYLPRNMFLLNCVYIDSFRDEWRLFFDDLFNRLLLTMNYSGAEKLLKAMDDILHMRRALGEDPDEQRKAVEALKANVRTERYQSDWESFGAFGDADIEGRLARMPRVRRFLAKAKRKIRKIVARQNNGLVNRLRRGEGQVLAWEPAVEVAYLKRSLRVYNILKRTVEIRTHDAGMDRGLRARYEALRGEISARYDELRKELVACHREVTSLAFWETYLGI